MKEKIAILLMFFSTYCYTQLSTNPSPFEVNQSVTITVDINSSDTNCNSISNPDSVYMHAGIGDDSSPWGYSVIGNWGQDDGVGQMSDNGNGTWSITIVPEEYFSLTAGQAVSATKMGLVFRNEDGTQELKDQGCSDFFINVGSFQVEMINPDSSGVILVDYNESTQILAQNTNGNADYELYANGELIDSQSNINFYNGYQFDNLTENQYCELHVTQNGSTVERKFTILINNTSIESIPESLEDGINYNDNDNTKAILVLSAPYKDFIYVAGDFNFWSPTSEYAMKKDSSSDRFWLEIEDLDPDQTYTYQYWVSDLSPIDESPSLVKTADPFSTMVLSPFDDPWIPEDSYPNLPEYPYEYGIEREVTVLKTGQEDYNWQVNDFVKPKKEDLIIYEVLIRDFDSERTYQNLIDRIDYFKDLNVNAIELMPVMEYEGNESWGYNTSFHMSVDKFYGPEEKLKQFVDLCHQNDIAVILDIALNHITGRSPFVRMWMNDPDNNGWGSVSEENPYLNEVAKHSYSVFEDFNHQSYLTQYYTKRVIKHWVEEFKIDGFRWDLTKGFTQNCNAGDDGCTNAYQQDRVDILKSYADYSWSLDPDHYVIFEHLGGSSEEQQWANYRLNEGKGIMMWGKVNNPYYQLLMGYGSDSNFGGIGHESRGFQGKRLLGYFESHDEERIMYKALQYGNNWDGYNIQELNIALSRMSAIGAMSLTIPGPKMIWHFSDLGMENSLFTCYDGSVNEPDCKLDTKPQPQWANNWLSNDNRREVYDNWSRIIDLKINEDVFEGNYSITSGSLTPIVYIWDDNISSSELKNVIILANFDVVDQSVTPYFPYTGTWFDLMDEDGETTLNVASTTDQIILHPGEFKIYGNQASTTLSNTVIDDINLILSPNPSVDFITINKDADLIEIYDVAGKKLLSFNNIIENQQLDINQLQTGYYIVKVYNNESVESRKLIKK
jgi:glycosidase